MYKLKNVILHKHTTYLVNMVQKFEFTAILINYTEFCVQQTKLTGPPELM